MLGGCHTSRGLEERNGQRRAWKGVGGDGREDDPGRRVQSHLPEAGLEERRVERLLYERLGEAGDAVWRGEEGQEEGDAKVGRAEDCEEVLRLGG